VWRLDSTAACLPPRVLLRCTWVRRARGGCPGMVWGRLPFTSLPLRYGNPTEVVQGGARKGVQGGRQPSGGRRGREAAERRQQRHLRLGSRLRGVDQPATAPPGVEGRGYRQVLGSTLAAGWRQHAGCSAARWLAAAARACCGAGMMARAPSPRGRARWRTCTASSWVGPYRQELQPAPSQPGIQPGSQAARQPAWPWRRFRACAVWLAYKRTAAARSRVIRPLDRPAPLHRPPTPAHARTPNPLSGIPRPLPLLQRWPA
jgi:hypothetical protein